MPNYFVVCQIFINFVAIYGVLPNSSSHVTKHIQHKLMKQFFTQIRLFCLACLLMVTVGAWGATETIATGTFDGKAGKITEGWSTTGTGKTRNDCVVIAGSENITSPSIDFSNYTSITIKIKARRFGTVPDSKATIGIFIGENSIGSVNATSTSATTSLSDVEYTIPESLATTTAALVFKCTNVTGEGSKAGAGVNSITIIGTLKAATEPFTVTFDAGTNGTCSTTSLTEASAGAGVTLPSCTANEGYTFVGWSTTENGTTADAGKANDKFEPTADCTLYAVYKAATVLKGDGTKENPYTLADVKSLNNPGVNAWVVGYIRGSYKNSTQLGTVVDSNIALSETEDGAEFIPVELASGTTFRTALNVKDNPLNVGRQVKVLGKLTAYFSTTGVKSLTDYEFVGGSTTIETVATPTFTPAAGTYTEAQNVTIACATEGATIYYTTDGSNPTTASTQYTAAIAVEKTTTIKAIAVKEGMYNSTVATAAYTINLPAVLAGEGDGTEASPYDVTRALDYIAKKQDATVDVYVEGIISGIKSIDVPKYERAQYYISKDGSENNQLYIFNGYYLNGEKFTANDQIKVGDKVVVCGKLKDYSGTKEMDANNKIVKHEASTTPVKVTPTLKFTPTAVTAYLDAKDEFTAPELSNEKNVAVTYSSSDTGVATVNASTGAVTIVAAGETTITASFAGDDEYNEASASYTLTVKATKPQGMAIVAEYNGAWYAAVPELSSKKLVAVEVAVIDGKVYYDGDKTIAWAYDEANGTFVTEDGKYLAKTGTGTDVTLSEESGSITWSVGTNGIVNTTTNDRVLIYRSGVGFGNYGGTNAGKSGYAAKSQVLPIGTAAELEAIASAPVTIGSTGYATYSPIAYDVTIPSGVEVYYVDASTVSDDCVVLTKYEGTALKQGEGVILKNSGSCTFAKATVAAEAIEDNALVGVSSDVTLKANSSYLLANDGGSAAFLLCEAGTLSAGKAYLPANGAKAPSLSIVIDDATAIGGLTTSQPHNLTTSVYNLAGQKVGVDYKGIVIVNGKKLIKK